MSDISSLKADLADLAARHSEEFERDTRKLIALARMIDAEQALHELEVSREQT